MDPKKSADITVLPAGQSYVPGKGHIMPLIFCESASLLGHLFPSLSVLVN